MYQDGVALEHSHMLPSVNLLTADCLPYMPASKHVTSVKKTGK